MSEVTRLIEAAQAGDHNAAANLLPLVYDELRAAAGIPNEELLAPHDALERFAIHAPVKAQLIELRFFGSMSLPEIAEHLGISLSTAERGWRYARAWL